MPIKFAPHSMYILIMDYVHAYTLSYAAMVNSIYACT